MISHNPYFNRWFSAIVRQRGVVSFDTNCHNPYFNRWFSAMKLLVFQQQEKGESQSLF